MPYNVIIEREKENLYMSIIEVENVTKRFDDKLVTDNISLNIEEGEIFGLLGPNGAGKSTLINIIVGLIEKDKGSVSICGMDISKEPLKTKRLIGLVPQEIALFEGLNARDNLEYFGGLYGLRGKELKERINEALSIVALDKEDKKQVKKYSGGMKRRLNIAAALMHHPKVIIMDEPTVGVDPQSRNYIFEMIKKINKERKTTIIYTSHYMEEVEELCSRVFILDSGKEIALGTKEELKRMVRGDKIIDIQADGAVEEAALAIKNLRDVKNVDASKGYMKIAAKETIELEDILKTASKEKIKIKNISVEETSLEEVFLTLTGKNLRDKEE